MAYIRLNPHSRSTTHGSALAALIKADIIRGELEDGAPLRMAQLCRRYNTSLIPLREALWRLTASGLVRARDHRGFHVTPVSPEDQADLERTRLLIEKEVLRRSILNGDFAWEIEVMSACGNMMRLLDILSSYQRSSGPGSDFPGSDRSVSDRSVPDPIVSNVSNRFASDPFFAVLFGSDSDAPDSNTSDSDASDSNGPGSSGLKSPRAGSSAVVHDLETTHHEFHRLLQSACDSSRLLDILETLRDQSARYQNREAPVIEPPDYRAEADEHLAIQSAAIRRDVDQALRLFERHWLRWGPSRHP